MLAEPLPAPVLRARVAGDGAPATLASATAAGQTTTATTRGTGAVALRTPRRAEDEGSEGKVPGGADVRAVTADGRQRRHLRARSRSARSSRSRRRRPRSGRSVASAASSDTSTDGRPVDRGPGTRRRPPSTRTRAANRSAFPGHGTSSAAQSGGGMGASAGASVKPAAHIKPKVVRAMSKSQRSRLHKRPKAGTRAFGKIPVTTPSAPAAIGAYSQAVRARGMVFVSGTVGLVVKPRGAGKASLAKVKKPKLREPPEFMREEERIAQLEANQKRWDKYLQDCLIAETRMALQNLQAVLEEAESSLSQVVQMTVMLTKLKSYTTVNRVCGEFFVEDQPARTVMQVKGLRHGAQVQVDCVALTN